MSGGGAACSASDRHYGGLPSRYTWLARQRFDSRVRSLLVHNGGAGRRRAAALGPRRDPCAEEMEGLLVSFPGGVDCANGRQRPHEPSETPAIEHLKAAARVNCEPSQRICGQACSRAGLRRYLLASGQRERSPNDCSIGRPCRFTLRFCALCATGLDRAVRPRKRFRISLSAAACCRRCLIRPPAGVIAQVERRALPLPRGSTAEAAASSVSKAPEKNKKKKVRSRKTHGVLRAAPLARARTPLSTRRFPLSGWPGF
ncbi:hypothetical protein HPB51_010738 [Rhipicephalus microplus]|uniref:Uncharacterized protein n=1 Tax=Rhipicephalus microplus TaxID=6941 RepID=A0A9J6DUJ2_RHIMP|nr:hypothetical protein HPB51_010738 [Rhipicephalus microplus]